MSVLTRFDLVMKTEPYCRMAPISGLFDGLPPFDVLVRRHEEAKKLCLEAKKLRRKKKS